MAQGFVDRCHIKDVGMCFFGIAVSIQAGVNWTQSREISEGWQSHRAEHRLLAAS